MTTADSQDSEIRETANMGFAQHFGVLCRSGSRNWLNHLPTRVNGRASEWGSMPLS